MTVAHYFSTHGWFSGSRTCFCVDFAERACWLKKDISSMRHKRVSFRVGHCDCHAKSSTLYHHRQQRRGRPSRVVYTPSLAMDSNGTGMHGFAIYFDVLTVCLASKAVSARRSLPQSHSSNRRVFPFSFQPPEECTRGDQKQQSHIQAEGNGAR